MQIPEFIATLPPERQQLLTSIHEIILREDSTVKATVGQMMGKDMILYNAPGMFKYGLASTKAYMSLHAMPIYMNPALHEKYKTLLPAAAFQKGCINFKSAAEMPLKIVTQLIKDCSKIDLLTVRKEQLAAREQQKKSKPKKS
ncbi:MAG: DUF1801 domain-containing protein [Bacteroidetes bacterium]|nr:DUF1801 domain-containing protein [Bacteroidota bacterium]